MALFNDGPINQQEDLANYENEILTLANTEQIDLDAKIALAQREIATRLLAVLLKQESRSLFSNWIDPQDMLRRRRGVSDVVVTDPLQQWHAMRTLAAVYRDAYNNQLNDRYRTKWQEYEQLGAEARQLLFDLGIGLASYWLPTPAPPIVTTTNGPGISAEYAVQVTWVNQNGQESAPSPPVTYSTQPGMQLVVTAPPLPPQYATGWNVYAGILPGGVTLQNSQSTALGTAWTMPSSGLAVGPPAGTGQLPDRYVVDLHVMPRG